jgi:CspA family cold shock protein
MPTERIKFFDERKGFGFIKPDEPGPEAYIPQFAVEAAGIQGFKPSQRVFYQLAHWHPIMGRPIVGSLCLIEEE